VFPDQVRGRLLPVSSRGVGGSAHRYNSLLKPAIVAFTPKVDGFAPNPMKIDFRSRCIPVGGEFRVGVSSGARFQISGFGFWVWALGFGVSGSDFGVSGYGRRLSGLVFRLSGLGREHGGNPERIWHI